MNSVASFDVWGVDFWEAELGAYRPVIFDSRADADCFADECKRQRQSYLGPWNLWERQASNSR